MDILVTGAAGYIGSIVASELACQNHQVFALDNLAKGHRRAVCPSATFFQADLADRAGLEEVFSCKSYDAVVHLAAHSIVSESVKDPALYFRENLANGLNLLEAMRAFQVKRLVFSSSAAVYGTPERVPITESAVTRPINPYGETKLMFERILRWFDVAYGIKSISLRYFNAAGAGELYGEHHEPETHLIPNVLKAALGKAPAVSIMGTDYETEDGTCVRDYIHVLDIAAAHIIALNGIDRLGTGVYNLGNGKGYSVLEVVKAAGKVAGAEIPVKYEARREGDPPVLVADATLAGNELGWKPRYPGIEDIIESAWRWQNRYPEGYRD